MFEHNCSNCGLPFETENEFDDTCPDCIEKLNNENNENNENNQIGQDKEND